TWSAAVPVDVATPNRAPTRAASSRSKRSTNGPADETKFESRHSLTYRHSLPPRCGMHSGISGTRASASNRVDAGSITLLMVGNPVDRPGEPVLERDRRTPAEHLLRAAVAREQAVDLASGGPGALGIDHH